jgi:hypothetical protein
MGARDAGDPSTGGRTGGRTGAVVLAAAIVAVAVGLVVAFVVFVVLDDGWSRVVWVVVGTFLLWQVVPRPERPSARAVAVSAQEAPALHALVTEVASAVGAGRPHSLVVDTLYATSLVPVGYRGRAALVLGLPQWTALDDDERIAVLAHELACVEPARSPAGILVRLADDLLTRLVLLLSPTAAVQPHETTRQQYDSGLGALGAGDELAGDRMRREVATSVGAAGLTVVASPARIVQGALRRAALPSSTRGCLHADRAAAALVGSPAVVGLLLSTLPVPRAWVAAEVAARLRADPFAAMAQAERPGSDELTRRLAAATTTGERAGPGHAPTAARVEALRQPEVVVRAVGPAAVRAADRDLDPFRARLAQRFAEELVHGRS